MQKSIAERTRTTSLIAMLCTLIAASQALAANAFWVNGAGTDFNLSANWANATGGAGGTFVPGVPGSADFAIFDANSGSPTITALTNNYTTNKLLINGGTLSLNHTTNYNVTGTGGGGGAATVNSTGLIIGNAANTSALSLGGGGTLTASNTNVGSLPVSIGIATGNNSTGTFTINNGQLLTSGPTSTFVQIAFAASATGTFTIDGNNVYKQAQWLNSTSGNGNIGGSAAAHTSVGIIDVKRGGYVESSGTSYFIGYGANAAVTGSNPNGSSGILNISGVAPDPANSNTPTASEFRMTGAASLNIGYSGRGELNITGGGKLTVAGTTSIGALGVNTSVGRVVVDGKDVPSGIVSTFASTGLVNVGATGAATPAAAGHFTGRNSALASTTSNLSVAAGAFTTGNLLVTDANSQFNTAAFFVGAAANSNGTATIQNGGKVIASGVLGIATNATSSTGNLLVTGLNSEVRAANLSTLGTAGSASGLLTISNSGQVNFTSATTNSTIGPAGTVSLANGSLNLVGGRTLTNNGVIAGSGTIGRFSGTGAVTVTSASGSAIRPGDTGAAGLITFDFGNLTANAGSTLALELGNPLTTTYDRISLTNDAVTPANGTATLSSGVTLGTTIDFSLLSPHNFTWGENLVYDLLTARVLTINSATLAAGQADAAALFPAADSVTLSAVINPDPNGLDVLRLTVVGIPEPATLTLFAGAMLFALRRPER